MAICARRLSIGRINRRDAGELVRTVVRRGLELVPVVHAVIALELGVVWNRVGWRAPVVVRIEVVRLVKQRKEEKIRNWSSVSSLSWTVHIGIAIGPETLRPSVKTGGQSCVDQFEGLAAIRRCSLLVKVHGDIRNLWLPFELHEQLRIVKWTGRSIHDMAIDTAVLGGNEGLHSEVKERVLSGKTLPTFGGTPRWIDSTRGAA